MSSQEADTYDEISGLVGFATHLDDFDACVRRMEQIFFELSPEEQTKWRELANSRGFVSRFGARLPPSDPDVTLALLSRVGALLEPEGRPVWLVWAIVGLLHDGEYEPAFQLLEEGWRKGLVDQDFLTREISVAGRNLLVQGMLQPPEESLRFLRWCVALTGPDFVTEAVNAYPGNCLLTSPGHMVPEFLDEVFRMLPGLVLKPSALPAYWPERCGRILVSMHRNGLCLGQCPQFVASLFVARLRLNGLCAPELAKLLFEDELWAALGGRPAVCDIIEETMREPLPPQGAWVERATAFYRQN